MGELTRSLSVVVIGINVETTIVACLDSIQRSNYPKECLEIIYVDGGSSDDSVKLAKQFSNIKIMEITTARPTPGLGRNRGWQLAGNSIVQFVDGDTKLDPNWLKEATQYLKGQCVAVCGVLKEVDPHKNIYHMIGEIEWDKSVGNIEAFGGNVMILKEALQVVGGYDDLLIAGEDPDLSYRLRQQGGVIVRLQQLMGYHELAMDSFSQYIRRAFRTGTGYAEIFWRYRKSKEKMWQREFYRIILTTTLPWILLLFGFFVGWPLLSIVLALIITFRSFRHIPRFCREYHLSFKQGCFYALHLSFVVYPHMSGLLTYFFRSKYK